MKRLLLITLILAAGLTAFAQAPHLYDHTYPVIADENPEIRALIDSVSVDSIKANKHPTNMSFAERITTHGTPTAPTPTPSVHLVPTTTLQAWRVSSKQPDY